MYEFEEFPKMPRLSREVIMTDRELLELAARVAGIEIVGPIEKYIVQPNPEHIGGFIVRNNRGGDSCWNPLLDGDDALRLAVKLQLTICNEHETAGVVYCIKGERDFPIVDSPESSSSDEELTEKDYANTRRAIVNSRRRTRKAIMSYASELNETWLAREKEMEELRRDAARYRFLRNEGANRIIHADSLSMSAGRGPYIYMQPPAMNKFSGIRLEGAMADSYIDSAIE